MPQNRTSRGLLPYISAAEDSYHRLRGAHQRIDRNPFRVLIICPLSVAMDGGKCLRVSSYERPGNDLSGLFAMAFKIVDFGGEPSV